jgi:hypothetical protein
MFSQAPRLVSQRPRYRDREDAADQLIDALRPHLNGDGLILAIPRGAVPMGARIAHALGATLDIVLVRKLGAPYNPEYALGAIDEDGLVTLGPETAHLQGSAWLEAEAKRQLALIRARHTLYGPERMAPPISGRTVVVVDDGLATGVTMIAALDWVRRRGPGQLIAVAPVGSAEAVDWARSHADRVICPWRPAAFGGVSEFYRNFPQVEDEQVIALLKAHAT